jgi:hypothetical protein
MTSKLLKVLALTLTVFLAGFSISTAQLTPGFVNDAALDVSSPDNITTILSQRYKALRSSGNKNGDELYIGAGDLSALSNPVSKDFAYQPTLEFSISYDAVNDVFKNVTNAIATNGTITTISSSIPDLKSFVGPAKAAILNRMNYMQMEMRLNSNKNDDGAVSVQNLTLNGTPISGSYSLTGKNTLYYNTSNVEFAAGFILTGKIILAGTTFNNAADANFLDFSWGYNANFASLPLKLTNFTGLAENSGQNKITWVSQDNNEGQLYEVERSSDGKEFVTIEKITVKSFANIESYTCYDKKPLAIAYYRIKGTDINNKIIYSSIIKIARNESATKMMQQLNQTQLTFPDAKERIITVYTMSGQMVRKVNVNSNQYVISHNNLKNGLYVLQVSGDGKNEAKQLLIL